MSGIYDVEKIKTRVESCVGRKVKVISGRGRRHRRAQSGVIEQTYPSIFVIKLDDGSKKERISVSYADVLTKTVQLMFLKSDVS